MAPSFEETIRSFSAQSYWDALLATGWVSPLPSAEQNNLQRSLEAHFEQYPQQAWTMLATVVFDSEGFYSAEDYTDILAEFATGSFGRFVPTHVTAVEEGDLFKISFALGKHTYEAALSATSDYFDEMLVSKINQALADLGTVEQFVLLPSFDQVYHYAFTTTQAVQMAKDRLLIPESVTHLPDQATIIQHIRNLTLTKAQFAILMARVVGDPFLLDEAALQDLSLSEQDITDAEVKLVEDGHLNNQKDVPSELANFLTAAVTPGWKWIVQRRSQQPKWAEMAIHFGETIIAGEALNGDEERLLTQFDSVNDAIEWLLDLIPDIVEGKELSPPKALEALLSQAQAVTTLLIVNTAEGDDGTQAAITWLLTDSGLWFIDNQANEGQATNITNSALHDHLRDLVNRYIPPQMLRSWR